MQKITDNNSIQGRLRIRKYKNGVLISEQNESNKVVSSSGYGRNLIVRQLGGDTTYGIAVDEGKIGTGTTAPTDSDTDLETAVLSSIAVESTSVSNDTVTFSFFILDASLADGNYTEFGLFIGGQMLSRALFTNTYAKGTGEDTRIDYQLQIT